VEKHAERLAREGTPQAIANTAWACAKLGVESPKLFLQVEKHAERLVREGNPQEIANTVWACATLGVDAPILITFMEANMEKLLKNGIAQGFCNICYALAISDSQTKHMKLLVGMWNRAVQIIYQA